MKQILPILTLTTLTAAAFADASAPAAAAASGFNYNTVNLSYSLDDSKVANDFKIQLTSLVISRSIGKGLIGTIGLHNGSETEQKNDLQGLSVGIGYVYTINSSLDLVASWTQTTLQTQNDDDSQNINYANYELGARYNVGSGIELNASVGRNNIAYEDGAGQIDSGIFRTTYSVGAAYKLSSEFAVNAKATWSNGGKNADSHGFSAGVSYNY